MTLAADYFRDEFEALKEYLDAVRATLRAGVMPNMAGFEKRVGHVCHKLQEAEESVQKQCLAELAVLLKGLDDCEQALRSWHEAAQKVESDHDNP